MKIFIYSIFLVAIISSDLVNTGYMIFCQDHHIEFSKDFSSEKESNEKTEVDEKEYELPLFSFGIQSTDKESKIIDSKLSKLLSKFSSSFPSPPPDLK